MIYFGFFSVFITASQLTTMSTLREFLSANEDNIPPMIYQRITSAVEMTEMNENEARMEEHLRVLIGNLVDPRLSPFFSIFEYLNSPHTQNSCTREVFSDIDWDGEGEGDDEGEDEVAEEIEELEEGEIRDEDNIIPVIDNDRRHLFQGVDDFLNMFPRRQ